MVASVQLPLNSMFFCHVEVLMWRKCSWCCDRKLHWGNHTPLSYLQQPLDRSRITVDLTLTISRHHIVHHFWTDAGRYGPTQLHNQAFCQVTISNLLNFQAEYSCYDYAITHTLLLQNLQAKSVSTANPINNWKSSDSKSYTFCHK